MEVSFIAQPQDKVQLGPLLFDALGKKPAPTRVTIVSAFASLVTVIRFKTPLRELHEAGAKVRVVVGVDMGGTSKEVLRELASWPCEVFVFKNKRSGITFHPKIYLVERKHSAEIFVGSNSLHAKQIKDACIQARDSNESGLTRHNAFATPRKPRHF